MAVAAVNGLVDEGVALVDGLVDEGVGIDQATEAVSPQDQYDQAGKEWDLGMKLGIPLNEIGEHYDDFILWDSPADPSSISDDALKYNFIPSVEFVERTQPQLRAMTKNELRNFRKRPPLPANALPIEKFDRMLHIIGDPALRIFYKLGKGMLLNSPDAAWAVIKKVAPEDMQEVMEGMTLDEAVDWAMDYNPGAVADFMSETAEFIGGISTVGKLLPKVGPGLLPQAARGAVQFGGARGAKELAKLTAELVDPDTSYGYTGAKGVVEDMAIGAGFSILASAARPLKAAISNTAFGRAIEEGAHKAAIALTKKFPLVMDTIRKDPQAHFTKQVLRVVKDRTGKNTANMTITEKAAIKHVAREGERRFLIAQKNYLKNVPPDIVQAVKRRGLALPGTKPPIEPAVTPSAVAPAAEPFAPVVKPKKPDIQTLTAKALTELGKAKRPRAIIEVEKTKELGKRVAMSAAAAERASGEDKLVAALGQLKGELTQYKSPDFTPLRDTMKAEDINVLHDDVWLRPHSENHFDKLNTAKAWAKVVEGYVPTRGEIQLLEKQWGKEFAKGLLKKRPLGDRAWDTAADVSNFMRTMLVGGDVSVAGRQLRVLGQRYPLEFGRAVKEGLKAYASEDLAKIIRKDYESSEFHREAKKYVQFFAPAGTEAVPPSERPEWYVSQYPERVPVIGHLIRMGNRNYVETMNMFTQSVWDKLRAQDNLNGIEPTEEQLRLRGKWLMSMTGRPEIGGVVGRRIAPIAAGFFFAPRFAVSRFTSPIYLRHLAAADPVAREIGRSTAKAFAAFIGTNLAVLALLKLALGDKAEIELDPRSPDWGKGKIGTTRIDLWAGHQQAARFLVQMVLGQYQTQAGDVKEIERLKVVGRFIRGKENPLVSLISDLYKGKTYEGDRPFAPPEGEMGRILDELKIPELIQGIGKEAYRRMLFIWVQDFIQASVNDGWVMGFTSGTLSFFGFNTASYEDTAFTKVAKFKNNIAQTDYDKDWDKLNAAQQKILTRTHKQMFADLELQAKIEGARRDDYDFVARLIEDEKKAGRKVHKQLQPENQRILKEAGISLGLSRRIGDWEIDDERYEEYQRLTAKLLDEKLSRLSDISGWADLPISRRIAKIELAVQIAKDKAKSQLRRAAKRE